MLATEELRQRHRKHSASFTVTARRLAEFLESVEAEEILLTQRLRDRESRAIRLEIIPAVESKEGLASTLKRPDPPPVSADDNIGELYGGF